MYNGDSYLTPVPVSGILVPHSLKQQIQTNK